jgi:hypothetical protein
MSSTQTAVVLSDPKEGLGWRWIALDGFWCSFGHGCGAQPDDTLTIYT